MPSIDLNADLGENAPGSVISDDAGLLELVSSANVSGGFHAGTIEGIVETLAEAVRRGVVIGAHPSYRDREHFGRLPLDVEPAVLQAEVEEQIGLLVDLAGAAGGRVAYVKPHGALYNRIVHDVRQAEAVVAGVRAIDTDLTLLGLADSAVLIAAERAGLAIATEAFADRGYLPDGTLVPRTRPEAVLHDPIEVARRVVRLAQEGVIRAVDGTDVTVTAQSICVHGDSPGAVAMAAETRRALELAGVAIQAFV